ncbi:MAG: carboxypeptidase-like regulatory domain-containing protein [bacterium]|nr:carboxypeptidase-like regulatory domain-containing protein [bacterium]
MTRRCINSQLLLISLLLTFCAAVPGAQRDPHTNPADFDFIEDGEWGGWEGVMTGRIIDPEGRPIPFARVRVHSKDIETRTDANGFFTVRGLQRGGHYSLIVGAHGFDGAVLRWIPIPSQQTADIGDYHLDYQLPSTNFWQVFSNSVAGAWLTSSNFCDIIEGRTNWYDAATWQRNFTEEGRIRKIASYSAVGENIVMTSECAMIAPTIVPPADTNAPAPVIVPPADTNAPAPVIAPPADTNAAERDAMPMS